MLEALRHGFSNYIKFEGNTARSTFWWWVLGNMIVLFVLSLIDAYIVNPALNLGFDEEGRALSWLYSLAIIIPNIAIGVRRLHDTGRSGFWLLVGFIPLLGALVLIYFFVQPGEGNTTTSAS